MGKINILQTEISTRIVGFPLTTNDQGIDKRITVFKIFSKVYPLEDINSVGYTPYNIYITNDDIPKLDEWGLNYKNNVIFKDAGFTPNEYEREYCRKIVLTSDHKLIHGGVQTIPEEILEWIIKNPTTTNIEVNKKLVLKENGVQEIMDSNQDYYSRFPEDLPNCVFIDHYEIILPKEGFRKNFYCGDEVDYDEKCLEQCENCVNADGVDYGYIPNEVTNVEIPNSKNTTMEKVKTFEEAAKIYYETNKFKSDYPHCPQSFIDGVKWVSKRMYSEDEVRRLLDMQRGNCYVNILSKTNNEELASIAIDSPEPGGINGTWVKTEQ